MVWCHPALDIASKSDNLDTMPVLNYDTRASSQPIIRVPSSKPHLWYRILTERLPRYTNQWAAVLIRAILSFGSPYCMGRLLQCLERLGSVSNEAWMWFLCMGAASVAESVASNHISWTQMSELGIPIRSQLIMSIFHKLLRKKDCKEQTRKSSRAPQVTSIISPDTYSLSFYAAIAYIIPSRLLKFSFSIVFLYRLLGWQSTITAVVTTLACFAVHRFTVKQINAARKAAQASRDGTTAALNEALYALREVKFSSTEDQWGSHIDTFREQELRDVSWTRTVTSIRGIWDTAAPFVVVTAALFTYLYTGGELTPSVVFPMITVLHQLQDTLSFIPVALNDYFHSVDTASRIDKYLASPEWKGITNITTGNVIFANATIAWPSDQHENIGTEPEIAPSNFLLRDMNIEFPAGELSIISGKTGAGKSLLLAGILGDADILTGHVQGPSPVAYVSQIPWLQNATLQGNILFGSPIDQKRYDLVIAACALQPDLNALLDGDQTQIGLRGVKLSGGQRTRLAFARALYSSASTMVLDDIFSTLDAHVANQIFGALTGELCKGRTRILVTHHVSLCLPAARYLVTLEHGTVSYAGEPESAVYDASTSQATPSVKPKSATESSSSESEKTSKVGKATAPASTKNTSTSTWHSLWVYFSAAGGLGFTCSYVLGVVASRLLNGLTSYLLGNIKSAGQPAAASTPNSDLQYNVSLYLWAAALSIGATTVSKLHTNAATLRAARYLFRKMTFNVLRMPLLWIDSTPLGETLKTFTVDARTVDDLILVSIAAFADSAVRILNAVFIGY